MKICKRGLNYIQVMDAQGTVRICCWMKDNYIGNLLENDLLAIYHSELADEARESLLNHTYDKCSAQICPYLANGTIDDFLIDIEEIPYLPDSLYLAYEGKCNYDCTCCTSHMNMKLTKENSNSYQKNYDLIEEKLLKVLPYIKTISAHGRGELFASPRILNILSQWNPVAPVNETEVILETNGSLFDEAHWKKIENLGKHKLRVAITIMSFNEPVYQYLSGVKYPIQKLIDNLYYVKKLREQNIINELEFATVLQEQNFREMPEFAKRCIEEFNVDRVRIRPIVPGGRLNRYEQWFMNVRNPEHPYHDEYLKVLSNQIFNHPKVSLWQGNLDSERISLSDMVENDVHRLSDSLSVERRVSNILSSMIMLEAFSEKFSDYMERKSFSRGAVWGMGKLGKAFLNMVDLKTAHIERLFDKELSGKSFKGIVIQEINLQKIKELDVIIITPVKCQNAMKSMLTEYTGEIVMLEDVIEEIKIFTEASQINER